MVACVHVGSAVRIAAVDIDQLKLLDNPCQSPRHRSNNHKQEESNNKTNSNWNCVACGASESPWLCLSCGLIHCGRYVNGDGLSHFKHYSEHAVTMDCHNYGVFCYLCDDYVADDTIDRKIDSIRNSLRFHNSRRSSDHCYSSGYRQTREDFMSDADSDAMLDEGTEDEDATPSAPNPRSLSKEDESVLEDVPTVEHSMLLGGRLLRPRKRKMFHDEDMPQKTRSAQMKLKGDEELRRGLRNLGNTCFMNAVLQALNSVDVFREFVVNLPLLEADEPRPIGPNILNSPRYKTRRFCSSMTSNDGISPDSGSTVLAEELRKTLIELSCCTSPSAVSPDAFFHAVWRMSSRFAGYQQQDSHEFLRYTLDKLHCDLRRCRIPEAVASRVAFCCGVDYSPSSSAVSLIFEGALQSQVTCMSCQMSSNKQDPFLDLSLDLALPVVAQRPASISLMDCVQRFFDKEELEQREQYTCGTCEERRPSTKQLFLRCLPKVLCLHVKRFRWNHISRGKLDVMVDFPLRGLDMTQFLAPSIKLPRGKSSAVFDLSAIVVHHGSGVSSGHYTSFGRHGESWLHFNDSTVRPCSAETVLKQKAYLLFYTRM